jgi:UDP-GlcNAc:undecaprenyl-phosphate GlcNAc-1-phosphate transferase
LTFTVLLLQTVLPAFILSALITPLVIIFAKKINVVAHPGVRKIHKEPIALLGGFSIYLTAILLIPILDYLFFNYLTLSREFIGFFVGSTMMLCLGMADDKIGLSAKEKLVFQFLAAIVVAILGWKIQDISLPLIHTNIKLEFMSIPLTAIWYVGVMNAFNMIDGLDGAATGIALIALSICAYIFNFHGQYEFMMISLVLVGALFGFLIFNFNPAKIFLGDTGSLFLGFVIALLATKAPSLPTPQGAHFINSCSIFVSISILFFPLLDMAFALIRRAAKGSGIFNPDKSHIHHKLLIHFSWNPKLCAIFIYFLGVCGALCGIMLFNRNTEGLIGSALLYAGVIAYVFQKFEYRESISKISKIQKNKTRTMLYLKKMMAEKIELVKSIDEIKRILEWTMEETELEAIEILSEEKTYLSIGPLPIDAPHLIFPLPAIKGKLRIKFKTIEFYQAELERDLCLQDIAQELNIALNDILKKDA